MTRQIAAIDIVQHPGGEALVPPSTSVVLGLQFHGRVRLGEQSLSLAGVTGLQTAARRYSYVGPTGSVLVRFTPQGAACLGVPLGELTNRSVALDDLIAPSRVSELRERLEAASDDTSRVAQVERLLLELPFARDPVVTRAIERLSAPETAGSVAAVARELGLSERQLERRFIARVGLTPKRFARLARFERALALSKAQASLAAAAQHAGYYDQAHFIRDFREFTGVTPSAYRRT